jgi:hypothetical protein
MIPFEEALASADRQVGERGVDHVSSVVRSVYLITQLDYEITLGSVLGWLTNTSGGYARETAQALDEIGATKCAEIVHQIISPFGANAPPLDDVARSVEVQRLVPANDKFWRKLADQLLEWPDDVDRLLREFVQRHETEFVEP